MNKCYYCSRVRGENELGWYRFDEIRGMRDIWKEPKPDEPLDIRRHLICPNCTGAHSRRLCDEERMAQ